MRKLTQSTSNLKKPAEVTLTSIKERKPIHGVVSLSDESSSSQQKMGKSMQSSLNPDNLHASLLVEPAKPSLAQVATRM